MCYPFSSWMFRQSSVGSTASLRDYWVDQPTMHPTRDPPPVTSRLRQEDPSNPRWRRGFRGDLPISWSAPSMVLYWVTQPNMGIVSESSVAGEGRPDGATNGCHGAPSASRLEGMRRGQDRARV